MKIYLHIGGKVLDATPEQIQKVMNLYNRPGTPGEKAAAAAALERMGVSPPAEPKPRFASGGSKRYEVIIDIEGFGTQEFLVEASDEIGAENKAREQFKKTWRSTGGGRLPKFTTRQAKRVH